MKVAADVIGIVDDDEGVRVVALDGLLRSAGFRVVMFSSAEALLGSPDLQTIACLILDRYMPDIGRTGGLQRRRAGDGHCIPLIIFTAHGEAQARVRAIDDGAVASLTKPFDVSPRFWATA